MINYKGIFADQEDQRRFYEGGAHFKYIELYEALEILQKEQHKKSAAALTIDEESKSKDVTINSQRILKSKLKIRPFVIECDNNKSNSINPNINKEITKNVMNNNKSKSCDNKLVIDSGATMNNKNKKTIFHINSNSTKNKNRKIHDYLFSNNNDNKINDSQLPKIETMYTNYRNSSNRVNGVYHMSNSMPKRLNNFSLKMGKVNLEEIKGGNSRNRNQLLFSNGIPTNKSKDMKGINLLLMKNENVNKGKNLNMFLKNSKKNGEVPKAMRFLGSKNNNNKVNIKEKLYIRNTGILIKPNLTENIKQNYSKNKKI